MAMKEQYYTIDGQMIGYKTAAGRKDFLTDALGSVTAEVDSTGATKTFDGRYKPYGGDLSSTGTGGSYGWVGALGYRETGLTSSSHYVRARHYSKTTSIWTTLDQHYWPKEAAYNYVHGHTVTLVDPSGNQGITPWCTYFRDQTALDSLNCDDLRKAWDKGNPTEALNPKDGFTACVGLQCRPCLPASEYPPGSIAEECGIVHEMEHCKQLRSGRFDLFCDKWNIIGGPGSMYRPHSKSECPATILGLRCLRKKTHANPCKVTSSPECKMAVSGCDKIFGGGGTVFGYGCQPVPEDIVVFCREVQFP